MRASFEGSTMKGDIMRSALSAMVLGLALAACGGGGMEVPEVPVDPTPPCDLVTVASVLPCAQTRVPTYMTSVSRVFVGGYPLDKSAWSYDGHSISIDACVESTAEYVPVSVCP
jgi:hypothetical protein